MERDSYRAEDRERGPNSVPLLVPPGGPLAAGALSFPRPGRLRTKRKVNFLHKPEVYRRGLNCNEPPPRGAFLN